MQGELIQAAVLQTAAVLEDAIDAELEEDLGSLRAKRLHQLKERAKKKDEWIAQGHGVYNELTEEKLFFEEAKKSERMAVHFYRDSNRACEIVDKHMGILARKHLEAKFMKMNAERCPFLTERLKIWMLPTIVLCKGGKTEHSIVGLDELGGGEDFPTEVLEWRISQFGVIDYDGPAPEIDKNAKKFNITRGTKAIQDSKHNYGVDSDEEYDD